MVMVMMMMMMMMVVIVIVTFMIQQQKVGIKLKFREGSVAHRVWSLCIPHRCM